MGPLPGLNASDDVPTDMPGKVDTEPLSSPLPCMETLRLFLVRSMPLGHLFHGSQNCVVSDDPDGGKDWIDPARAVEIAFRICNTSAVAQPYDGDEEEGVHLRSPVNS